MARAETIRFYVPDGAGEVSEEQIFDSLKSFCHATSEEVQFRGFYVSETGEATSGCTLSAVAVGVEYAYEVSSKRRHPGQVNLVLAAKLNTREETQYSAQGHYSFEKKGGMFTLRELR